MLVMRFIETLKSVDLFRATLIGRFFLKDRRSRAGKVTSTSFPGESRDKKT